jgi:hypothetical protein
MWPAYEYLCPCLDKTDDTKAFLFGAQYDVLKADYFISGSSTLIESFSNDPEPQLARGTYRHFKGKNYDVFALGFHVQKNEWMVLYKPLYDVPDYAKLCVRTLDNFLESLPDGSSRFVKL